MTRGMRLTRFWVDFRIEGQFNMVGGFLSLGMSAEGQACGGEVDFG